jgi:hypothetical protein
MDMAEVTTYYCKHDKENPEIGSTYIILVNVKDILI